MIVGYAVGRSFIAQIRIDRICFMIETLRNDVLFAQGNQRLYLCLRHFGLVVFETDRNDWQVDAHQDIQARGARL